MAGLRSWTYISVARFPLLSVTEVIGVLPDVSKALAYGHRPDSQLGAGIFERLARLYLAAGDTTRSAEFYSQFIELWKNAEPAPKRQ